MPSNRGTERLPGWFRIRPAKEKKYGDVRGIVRQNRLNTVCSSAACPNRTECWNSGTAAFMILGNVCTRRCGFCNVPKGIPKGPDIDEPGRVADAVAALKLGYAVITSVTRDDLPDGGAGIFAETIAAVKGQTQGCRVEALIPDFNGCDESLNKVVDAKPDVLNHNIETVPSLYSRVRPQADYMRSIGLLSKAKERGAITKTGLMLGFGEGLDEVRSVMHELRHIKCDLLTIGQYLQPARRYLPVERYYSPDDFAMLKDEAARMGFGQVEAGPLVRSSYRAG